MFDRQYEENSPPIFCLSLVQTDATWLGVVASVCTLLQVLPVSNFAQQLPTTRNNMQLGVQTDATCNFQQCCVLFHGALPCPY